MAGIDFERSAAAATGCSACGRPLAGEYWMANGRVACVACKAAIDGHRAGPGPGAAGLALAALFGTGAMLAGAATWWAIAKFTGFEAALVALGIGWLVGKAIMAGSGHRGGLAYQLMAVVMTYLAIVLAYTALILAEAGTWEELGAAAVPIAFVYAFVAPFMGGWSAILSVIIIGVGLHMAWRSTAPGEIAWQGPFAAAPPSPPPPPGAVPPPLPGREAPPA